MDYEYMFLISSIASIEYPMSFMRATNLGWSIDPKDIFEVYLGDVNIFVVELGVF